MTSSTASVSMVIPVYNEAHLVAPCVERSVRVFESGQLDFEIVLVNDGSRDGTLEAMQRLAEKDTRVRVVDNLINLNVGIALQRGLAAARKPFVVHNGVDLPFAPEDVARLVPQMAGTDVLVVERDQSRGYAAWRRVTSFVNRLLLRVLFPGLSRGIRDMNYMQMYRQEALKAIRPLAKSPSFTTPEMIMRARRCGLRVRTFSAAYHARPSGAGAFGRPHDIIWSLSDMLRFRLLLWLGRIPAGGRS